MNPLTMIMIVVILYFVFMVGLGTVASRTITKDSEGYFLANRGMSSIVLFAAIFGTNMSAFVMLGLAGSMYHIGVGLWAILAAPTFLIIPLNFYFGYRCWLAAKRYGYVTPVEFYRERFQSEVLAVIMFIVFVAWTMPYVLTGIVGAGRAFSTFTGGAIPYWVAGLAVSLIVAYYTLAGGMKGTAWTNAAQVLLFMGFLITAIILVPIVTDGPSAILQAARSENPGVLVHTWAGPTGLGPAVTQFLLFMYIIFLFPFVWIRMIAARRGKDLRFSGILYPIALVLTWGPAALLGLWGIGLVPGLEGAEADSIIFIITANILPEFMVALGLVGLLSIIMSSMDAQVLTMSNMLSWDIIARYGRAITENRAVLLTRIFVVVLIAVLYLLSLVNLPGIFDIAQFAFTGFLTLGPTMVGGIFWRRATKQGAIASLLVGQVVAIGGFLGLYPTIVGLGPAVWVFVTGWITFILVSLVTSPQTQAAQRFHDIWDEAARQVEREAAGPSGSGAEQKVRS